MSVTAFIIATSLADVEQFARENDFNVTIVGRKETKWFFGFYTNRERLRVISSNEQSFRLGGQVIRDMLSHFGKVEMWKNLTQDLELSSKFLPPGVNPD